jgi:hypothetical protein
LEFEPFGLKINIDCDGGKKFKNKILIKEPAMEILLYLA